MEENVRRVPACTRHGRTGHVRYDMTRVLYHGQGAVLLMHKNIVRYYRRSLDVIRMH